MNEANNTGARIMNLTAKTIPLFRFSGATRIEALWVSSHNWVRPISRWANRWTTLFFLRPWVGSGVDWNAAAMGRKFISQCRFPQKKRPAPWRPGLHPGDSTHFLHPFNSPIFCPITLPPAYASRRITRRLGADRR
ncbi:MAG: hypothetical protein ACP5I1_13170 [Candidatus Hinthialibacter sp.]